MLLSHVLSTPPHGSQMPAFRRGAADQARRSSGSRCLNPGAVDVVKHLKTLSRRSILYVSGQIRVLRALKKSRLDFSKVRLLGRRRAALRRGRCVGEFSTRSQSGVSAEWALSYRLHFVCEVGRLPITGSMPMMVTMPAGHRSLGDRA